MFKRKKTNAEINPTIGVGTLKISDRAKKLVNEVLSENRLSYGPKMKKFEKDFSSIHGCRFGVMSNSGTSALQVALQSMKEIHGWKDGDEIVIPSVTFVATANIVLHCGMIPVLVDVESEFYEIDPNLVEEKITEKTRGIIPVHLFGQPADMDPLLEIASKYSLKVIEDSAETMFATYKGKHVGCLGDIGCFSTYVAHLLVTGVGGISTTNNPDYATRMLSLINHGRDSIYVSIDDDDGKSEEELKTIISRRFQFTSIGHSFRVTEMEAALGLAQLEESEQMIKKRRANGAYITDKLSAFSDKIQLPKIREDCEHSFMMYPIVMMDDGKVDLVNFLENNGVETRDMLPLTNQPIHKKLLRLEDESYPVAKWINESGFYIASHQDLNPLEMDYIGDLFEKFFHKNTKNKKGRNILLLLLSDYKNVSIPQAEDLPTELLDEVHLIVKNKSCLSREQEDIIKLENYTIIENARNLLWEVLFTRKWQSEPDNLIFLPLNNQFTKQDITSIVLSINRGNDMVIGSRFISRGGRQVAGNFSLSRNFGNRIFNLLVNLLFLGNITDSFSPIRAVRFHKLKKLHLKSNWNSSSLLHMTIMAIKSKWYIDEVPVVEIIKNKEFKRILASIFPSFLVLIKAFFSRSVKK